MDCSPPPLDDFDTAAVKIINLCVVILAEHLILIQTASATSLSGRWHGDQVSLKIIYAKFHTFQSLNLRLYGSYIFSG